MGAIALWLLDGFFRVSGLYFSPVYYSLAFGPLLYCYVRCLVSQHFWWSWRRYGRQSPSQPLPHAVRVERLLNALAGLGGQGQVGGHAGLGSGAGLLGYKRALEGVAAAVGTQAQVRPQLHSRAHGQLLVGAALDEQRGLLAVEQG